MDSQEFRNELVRLAPPAGVSVTSFFGVPLSDWVYIATIIYILIQCGCLLYKTFKKKGDQ
jgi:hypothetical protein